MKKITNAKLPWKSQKLSLDDNLKIWPQPTSNTAKMICIRSLSCKKVSS